MDSLFGYKCADCFKNDIHLCNSWMYILHCSPLSISSDTMQRGHLLFNQGSRYSPLEFEGSNVRSSLLCFLLFRFLISEVGLLCIDLPIYFSFLKF